jgi:16S rRNA (cytidine1402-2'-O)-methyltransferase
LPSRATARKKLLLSLKDRAETLIFYESPKRLTAFLEEAVQILGERQIVLAREMTKIYEEIYRGTAVELFREMGEEDVKGEVTIVIEGCTRPPKIEASSIAEMLGLYFHEMGLSMKEAIERVATELEVSKRDVYKESLKIKGKITGGKAR